MRALLAIAAVPLVIAGCARKSSRHYVERIEVEGDTVAENAVMALSPAQVERLLQAKLETHGQFTLLEPGQKAPEGATPVRLQLVLDFTREAQQEGRPGTYAEVGATLTLRPRVQSLSRYEVTGLGEVKVSGDSLDGRQEAVRQALGSALDEVVAAAHFQLRALTLPDEKLVKDLGAADRRVRDAAIRVLAERRNPVVADALLQRLHSPDGEEVRRAIGGLVELKDPRAVPALIDLARAKDVVFLREILFALSAIGGEEAQAYLFTVAQGHDQPAIRSAAQQALDELEARRPPTPAGSGGERE